MPGVGFLSALSADMWLALMWCGGKVSSGHWLARLAMICLRACEGRGDNYNSRTVVGEL